MPTLANTVSPRHLAALIEHLEGEGLDCSTALGRAGITRSMLAWERVPVSAVQIAMEEVARASGRTDLGFVRGLLTQVGANHVATQLLMSAPTLNDGLTRLAPYMPLVSPAVHMQSRWEQDALLVEWTLARPLPYPLAVMALESVAVVSHRLLLFLMQEAQLHYELGFSWEPPVHASRYRELKCPQVRFGLGGQTRVLQRFPAALVTRPLPLADERMQLESERRASAALRELAQESSYADWTRAVLMSVEDEILGLDDLARMLKVSGRTLARQLALEQVRYGDIAQDIREQRAIQMLLTTDASVGDIAARLGYSSPANFVRAFKARTQRTPAQFRREHADRHSQHAG